MESASKFQNNMTSTRVLSSSCRWRYIAFFTKVVDETQMFDTNEGILSFQGEATKKNINKNEEIFF